MTSLVSGISELVSESHAIEFFNTPDACIANFEEKHWTTRVVSLVQSFGTLLSYLANKISLIWNRVDEQMDPYTTVNDNAKKRLVVCIHGLNDNPSQFKSLLTEMQGKDLSGTAIYTPRVYQKGNATLDEMTAPIVAEIVKWAETSPGKELVLVGVSNGGRIARAVETQMSVSPNKTNIEKLRFISIVGACKGSYLADLANQLGLWWLMSPNISKEMPTESARNKQLDEDWMQAVSAVGPKREYTFFAAPHDWQVPNYNSSLMEVPCKAARYAIVTGHGHNSIVDAVAKSVAEIALQNDKEPSFFAKYLGWGM